MCGIAGVVGLPDGTTSERDVRAMLSRLVHRGPDDEGLASVGGAVLGARRLSIIDVANGRQPMANEDGSVIAVQNGEIYNFTELREELRSRGHRFLTGNDTEVLPHAYEEWGEALVSRLRGMFAIAIWDDRRRMLVLARDRFGKKPLYYTQRRDAVLFASEIQALLAVSEPRDLDDEALVQYLTLGYIPAPRTAFTHIRKVAPAHSVVVRDGAIEARRYWQLQFEPKLALSVDAAAEELRARIDEAVRIRLMSDVPLGAFLSGGLDSSTVVAYMARHSVAPVKTFSVGFGDKAYDELSYARVVARTFATEHHELTVDHTDVESLPMLVRHLGEPFADSSIVPTYHVALLTRGTVTVALNGDGGDELFAGYDRFRAAAAIEAIDRLIPRAASRAAGRVAEMMTLPAAAPRSVALARRAVAGLGLTEDDRYLRWAGYFTGALGDRIFGERLRSLRVHHTEHQLSEAADLTGARDVRDRYLAADIEGSLPGDLLVKMDIATMSASLEARSPLLDHELAEFVARLPASYKVTPAASKIVLRRAMRGILPPETLRRGKMGFTAPVGSWLRGPLRNMLADVVASSIAVDRGLVSVVGFRQLFEEHTSGRADRTRYLWSLLMLDLWLRECVVPLKAVVVPRLAI